MSERRVPGPLLDALQLLRLSSGYVADLCTAVIVGGATNRNNALPLLPNALRELRARVEAAIDALERER